MTDPSLVDHMTQIKLKLLEKKLENKRRNADETPLTTARSSDGYEEALQGALQRRRELLQRLREQQLLEEISRPHTWGGSHQKRYLEPLQQVLPVQAYHPPPPPAQMEPPRIIQQQIPQQPATIIQQLPPQQPLITQIPSLQSLPPIRSGSIKEDMVEMMLMQNAQMHQIIMQNMMLKALPPMAFSPSGSVNTPFLHQTQQVPQFSAPVMLKPEKTKPSSVHHHHHYMTSSHAPPPAPGSLPSFTGYSMWPPAMPSNMMGQGFPHTIHHRTGPTTMLPGQHIETQL
ncbi:uncharacterized protein C21orf58 homolog [Rhinatrema bivittatum]|uniref:uncharacterized protein C21orf58 homolog n=1 Tax=Rhinatrema bivittatum TaxID=194408 RepID=UPI00112DE51E|nr:uncharacterized protein C21orf58 homolog [Rhinatrema bivittatum]XP_029463577.1 uncharacterized protein C21orf58 homolog [Rhinatrema bivittatum]XP_029463578.1 uncharacterized protein C21orf58 homolog [Rhinatrema bivittatum]